MAEKNCTPSIPAYVCLVFLLITFFLFTGCNKSSFTNTDIRSNTSIDIAIDTTIEQDIDGETDETIFSDNLLTMIGEWQDEYGRGYTMSVTENENSLLFAISFTPHGGIFLNWVLPCESVVNDSVLNYDNGIMAYTEFAADENGDAAAYSDTEEQQVGSFSYDSTQDILCWCNGVEGEGEIINFIRLPENENQDNEIEIINVESEENGGYEYFDQESNYNTELSDAELIKINDPISVQLAHEFRNAYNKSVPQSLKISNIHVRNIYPAIKREESIATVATEVEVWFNGQGGSSESSVYTVVIISTSSGDVLSATMVV